MITLVPNAFCLHLSNSVHFTQQTLGTWVGLDSTESYFFLFRKLHDVQWDVLTFLDTTELQFLSLQRAYSGTPGRWGIFHWKWLLAFLKVDNDLGTHLQFFLGPRAGTTEAQVVHTICLLHPWSRNPGFLWKVLLLWRGEKYKPKLKNQEEKLCHSHQKSWSSPGKWNFMWFGRSRRLFTIAVYSSSCVPDTILYSKTSALWCPMDKSIQSLLRYLDFPF